MKTLFVTPGTSIAPSAGTWADPIRVRNAREFDDVLRRPGPHRFVLLPGTYETRGAWAFPERDFCSLGADSQLIGLAGSEATTIRLARDFESQVATPAGPVPAQTVEVFIAGSRGGQSSHLRIEGITLDCACPLPVVGLHAFTSRASLRDVRVVRLWGDWDKRLESFGILVNNCKAGTTNGGHVIEDCRVEQIRPGTYITGIYCGVVDTGVPIETSHIVRCRVRSEIPPGTVKRSHAGFASNLNTRLAGCQAHGFARWFFCDTGDVADLVIDGCGGSFSYCAVDLPGVSTPQNRIRKRSNVRIVNSTFDCLQPSSNHAILLLAQDGSPAADQFDIEDLSVSRCTVRSVPTDFYAVSIKSARARRIEVSHSTLPDNSKTVAGVFPPTDPAAVLFA
ncbi:MAG: hypothetical protein AB7J34_07590 [Limisphaerales bacterium]